jgi:hypothetical protein
VLGAGGTFNGVLSRQWNTNASAFVVTFTAQSVDGVSDLGRAHRQLKIQGTMNACFDSIRWRSALAAWPACGLPAPGSQRA